jgi:hypothetical protein
MMGRGGTFDPVGDLLGATGDMFKYAFEGMKGSRKKGGSRSSGTGITVGGPGTVRAIEEYQKNQARVAPIAAAINQGASDLDLETPEEAAGSTNSFSFLSEILGGGGGGSASERLAEIKARNATNAARGVMDMITSGSYASPYTAMAGTLADYLSKAQTGIQGLYGGAKTAAQEAYATNPYANLTGTATTASSGLEGLLASQGASTDPLAQMVAANREAAGGRAAAFTDLARMLGANYEAAGKQAQADIGAMQAGSLQDLISSGAGYRAAIAAQQAAALKALQDQLMESANQGADLSSLVKKKRKKG